MRLVRLSALSAILIFGACSDDSGGGGDPDANNTITPVAPTQVSMVASGGFEAPMDAVASPDGSMFYFSAYDLRAPATAESTAAIFSVNAAGGTPEVMHTGLPLVDPTGLLMSCDGSTLYIADLGYQSEEAEPDTSAIYTLDVASGTLTPLTATGIGEAASLAFNTDCSTLYATGYTPIGDPAVFTLAPAGGSANALLEGAPLESPSGVYVDSDNVAWVMDHKISEQLGGLLWAIQPDGSASEVVSDLRISEPAGVSLVSGGVIAVIPTRNDDGEGQLLTVRTDNAEMTTVNASDMIEPAGIRTAINAPVMAVVDADGDAIFRAE